MQINDFSFGPGWKATQAQYNSITMSVFRYTGTDDENGLEGTIGPSPEYKNKVFRALLANDLKINMNATWNPNTFIAGLNTADIKLGRLNEHKTKTGFAYYAAGPYSTQVYGGSEALKLQIEFTCYNDTTMYPALGIAESANLTRADEMGAMLAKLMVPIKVMDHRSWDVGEGFWGQFTADVIAKGAPKLAGKALGSFVTARWGKLPGEITKDLTENAANLASALFVDVLLKDGYLRNVLRNPGNDFLYMNIANYISGFFVCNQLSTELGKERIMINNVAKPRQVKFTMTLTSLEIPSKESIKGNIDSSRRDKEIKNLNDNNAENTTTLTLAF